ncbi:MAG TPA: hypothetical protein VG323_03060, partial [Thermoanaerobaculia bacterium]|nr:hypothetical protein [Thermoanaerobaculia bacterium]
MKGSLATILLFLAHIAAAQQPYLVKDLRTAGPISGSSSPQNFVVNGSTLYFLASNGEAFGLWRSDGTAGGTTFIAPMPATRLTPLGDHLIGTSYRL